MKFSGKSGNVRALRITTSVEVDFGEGFELVSQETTEPGQESAGRLEGEENDTPDDFLSMNPVASIYYATKSCVEAGGTSGPNAAAIDQFLQAFEANSAAARVLSNGVVNITMSDWTQFAGNALPGFDTNVREKAAELMQGKYDISKFPATLGLTNDTTIQDIADIISGTVP